MANKIPKTLRELNIALRKEDRNFKGVRNALSEANKGEVAEMERLIELTERVYKLDKDRLQALKLIESNTNKNNKTALSALDTQIKKSTKLAELQDKQLKSAKQFGSTIKNEVSKAFDKLIKQNQEVYNISQKMQVSNNLSWKQYTELYNASYEAARKMNAEFGKQFANAQDLFKMQEQMSNLGWRGMSASQMTNISTQMSLMARVLGSFDTRLATAFQMSFRQFGNSTDIFINKLTNNLNEFSDSLGMSAELLTTSVADMMASNSFIARNNMQAQIRANQSLIQAAALSSEIGILTSNFINNLAKTAQYGTAGQMSELYQAGAYLSGSGFSTYDFQQQLQNQDYLGATEQLVGSIYETLNRMEPGYLRNEYMAQIGSGFGLSQDDILQIMTNGDKLDNISTDISDKLKSVNTSVEDEIKDLNIQLTERLDNFWTNSKISQNLGQFMMDNGLVGIEGHLKTIIAMMALSIQTSTGQSLGSMVTNKLGLTSAGGGLTSSGSTALIGGAKVLGGVGIGVGANVAGNNMIVNSGDDGWSRFGGHAANILGGTAGGALAGSAFGPIGTAVGAGVGLIAGITNSVLSEGQRTQNIRAAEADADARAREARASSTVSTGNPIVDKLDEIKNAIVSEGAATRGQQMTIQLFKDNQTKNFGK